MRTSEPFLGFPQAIAAVTETSGDQLVPVVAETAE